MGSRPPRSCYFFFFNDTATTEIYTLSLHDALPISFQTYHGPPGGLFLSLAGGNPRRWRPSRLDRKSTRLNSSHSQISYAVFCLKKKKNNAHTISCLTKSYCRSSNLIVAKRTDRARR